MYPGVLRLVATHGYTALFQAGLAIAVAARPVLLDVLCRTTPSSWLWKAAAASGSPGSL